MKLIIGADIVPTKSNIEVFRNGNTEKLVDNKLQKILSEADYTILNLEVPLTDIADPILKCGPNLIAPSDTINGIKKLGVNILSLANNHIMDQNIAGLKETINILKKEKIGFLGAGLNLREASKPYIIEKNNLKIGLYACAEHEFSIASVDMPGANPYEPLDSFDHTKKLKNICDYVIVLFHGGKEHYRYPSPYLQRIFRKFATFGADLVVAQHSHCVGCKEEYQGSTLIYGQGNFLFDANDNEYWNNALLLKIIFDNEKNVQIDYIPIEKNDIGVRLASNESRILSNFYKRSNEIENSDHIVALYREFATQSYKTYLSRISGRLVDSILFRILNKISGHKLIDKLYNKKNLTAVENIIDCESHRELFSFFLKEYRKNK